jgi:hypothetical protein
MKHSELKQLIKEEIQKIFQENKNPLMDFVKNIPLSGESMKDFINTANSLDISQLQEILPYLESQKKFYSGRKGGYMAGIYNRKKDMLNNFIQFTQEIISSKQKDKL